jgi:hypothetical protein
MSLEGGAFICYRHEFETDSVKKWDKHCYETKHTCDINQQCRRCGDWNRVEDYPVPERMVERMHSNKEEDKDVIVLKCKNCGFDYNAEKKI